MFINWWKTSEEPLVDSFLQLSSLALLVSSVSFTFSAVSSDQLPLFQEVQSEEIMTIAISSMLLHHQGYFQRVWTYDPKVQNLGDSRHFSPHRYSETFLFFSQHR